MTVVPVVALVMAGAAAWLALRRYRRGWETWGDIVQMGVALAVIGGVVSSWDQSMSEGLVGAVLWGVAGSWAYLASRPAKPRPAVKLEPRTREQHSLFKRLERTLAIGVVVYAVLAFGGAALEVMERLTAAWMIGGLVIAAIPLLVTVRLRNAIRESGPPYDRDFGKLPKPDRW